MHVDGKYAVRERSGSEDFDCELRELLQPGTPTQFTGTADAEYRIFSSTPAARPSGLTPRRISLKSLSS